ncbi:MAG: CsbD family protein [Pseudanabaena sp. ELA645]|jgi:uncharacterized protein YjbJ (UPF0337 family)
MFSIQQFRSFFGNLGLSIALITVLFLGFGSEASWATSSSTQRISQPESSIATTKIATMKQDDDINNAKGKVKEAIGNMTGDREKQAEGKAMQFKAKTLDGLNNSIQNPNYNPKGQKTQTETQSLDATERVENQVRDTFK